MGANLYPVVHTFRFGGYADYLCRRILGYAGCLDCLGGVVYGHKIDADSRVGSGCLDSVAVDNELVAEDVQGVYGVFVGVDKFVDPAGGVSQAFYFYRDVFGKAAQRVAGTKPEGNRVLLGVVGLVDGIEGSADVGCMEKYFMFTENPSQRGCLRNNIFG